MISLVINGSVALWLHLPHDDLLAIRSQTQSDIPIKHPLRMTELASI